MPVPVKSLEPLTVREVLLSSLPTSLGTSQEPDRYTVEAVFERRPEPEEVRLLIDADTKACLLQNGYSEVRLRVADRRLIIERTTLEELRDGLAEVIATVLGDVSDQVTARRVQDQLRVQAAADGEMARSTAVSELARSISFSPLRGPAASDMNQTADGRGSTP